MKKRGRLGILCDRMYVKIRYLKLMLMRRNEAKYRLKAIGGGYRGSEKEYREKVVKYWKPYGVRPAKYWYQMYCDGKTEFDPRYIPDTLYISKIYPYFDNMMLGAAYANKGMYDLLFPELNKPRTIVKNCSGRYYDDQYHLLTKEQAIEICAAHPDFIIKPSSYSSGGKNVQVFKNYEADKETIRALFADMKFNFIVQELVDQHEYLANIHRESVNTLRVISFFFKDEVHILSSQLRMGYGNARVDNYTAGGFACNVNEDGTLGERAVSKMNGWSYEHPCGMKFKDMKVPSFDKVIEVVKREHVKIPELNIIGWDFAIGKDGEPVFIELNFLPESNQNGSGPTFGDLTEEVLQDVFIDKTLEGAFE